MAVKLAIVGAGWAGMAAAVTAAAAGAQVTVFEATRSLGGRARALPVQLPDGTEVVLDNGQHILIGAYQTTLQLMQQVGVDLKHALLDQPLGLPFPDGTGLQTPRWAARWPAPLDALAAIVLARGWGWHERLGLLRASQGWHSAGFVCDAQLTVAQLCAMLPARVQHELIEPLCVSALNTPAEKASAQVFLRVLRDALFGQGRGGFGASHLLLPRTDLSALFPAPAAAWLAEHHPSTARVRLGTRVLALESDAAGWRLRTEGDNEHFDQVVWATAHAAAATALHAAAQATSPHAHALQTWADTAQALRCTAITTVYAWQAGARLRQPLLALRAEPTVALAPAQFVFDRGQLAPNDVRQQGVLAFVVSASSGEREALQAQVLQQAERQLGLRGLVALQTVVEKRATFACTPGLLRPSMAVAPGLWAAGDFVQGPYPATLEGAVRNGVGAAGAALAT